jgi:hypothetical protein
MSAARLAAVAPVAAGGVSLAAALDAFLTRPDLPAATRRSYAKTLEHAAELAFGALAPAT